MIRNLIKNNKIIYGGGAAEISCSLQLQKYADNIKTTEQYSIRAFADALDQIPISLAENSGYSGIEYLSNVKSHQARTENPYLGIDCLKQVFTF